MGKGLKTRNLLSIADLTPDEVISVIEYAIELKSRGWLSLLKNKTLVILSSIVGFILGNVGLSKIVRWTVPWLFLTYPALIVIIIFVNLLDWRKFRYVIMVSVIAAIVFSVPDTLIQAGLGGKAMPSFVSFLPFGGAGLGWIIPALIGLILGGIIQLALPKTSTPAAQPNLKK